MPVKCMKCSQPIALTDSIELTLGRLSHVDCKGPQALTPEERALVFVYCVGHVAWCLACNCSVHLRKLAGDLRGESRNPVCHRCRRGLTKNVRAHLFCCAMVPSELRLRVQAVRKASRHLVKESRHRDRSGALIREAEAALFERQRALREAMSRVKAPNSPHSIT
jgi:hypothetical protein